MTFTPERPNMPPESLDPDDSPTPQPAIDELETLSRSYLEGFPEHRRRAILAEARRKRARLSSIPWHANRAKRDGDEYWLSLSISYMGED